MGLWDLVYPKKCLGCGKSGKYFCPGCLKKAELSDECFNNHLSIFCYRGIIREAIKKLKFKFLKDIEPELKTLLVSGLRRKLAQPNTELFREFLSLKPAVQSLPLYWRRHNWRGFNQAEIVGKIVAESLRLPHADYLRRVRPVLPQSRLERSERLTNIRGVFKVKPGRLPDALLLVDDVWTTGATLREAIEVLRLSGVKDVWGLTMAR